MKNKLNLALFVAVFLMLNACKSILLTPETKNTPTNCFNMLYKTVDENYSFFEYKHINWDSIRNYHAPYVNDKMPNDSLYNILSGMLSNLSDGHVNMVTDFDRSRNWSWYRDFPQNYNEEFVNRAYLSKDCYYTGSLVNAWIDSIGYMHYSSFANPIKTEQLNFVLNRFKNAKAIIIDVRDNGGGSMNNIFQIMERFTSKKTYLGTIEKKNGPAHNDFSKADSMFATPVKKKLDDKKASKDKVSLKKVDKNAKDTLATFLNKPVIILTNRLCYSATDFFVGFMKQLPNVTVIGDQTGGGGGLPIGSELPNGWRYRFSATKTSLPDGFMIENGVPPHIKASTGPEDELKGKDGIIERALQFLKEGK
jgi:C-terminal processing protease CtpA/Prc